MSPLPFRCLAPTAAVLAACAGLSGGLRAQEAPNTTAPAPPSQPEDPYSGWLVREVRLVRPAGPEETGQTEPVEARLAQVIQNTINLTTGLPYRRVTVEDDVRKLNRLGRFDRISSSVEPLPDGSVIVTYLVVERPIVKDAQTVGNRLLSDEDIISALGVIEGTPIDPFQIDRAARAIEDLYRQKGYYLAQVTIDDQELAETGTLLFRVREGERVRVTDIRFDGNMAFTPRELKTAIKTREADLLFETGPLDDDVLADDIASLVSFYRDRGYLDARADRRVQPSPNNREAIVTFLIDEGPLYSLRDIQVRYVNPAAIEKFINVGVLTEGGVLEAVPRARPEYLTPEQARAVGAGVFTQAQIAGLFLVKGGDVYGARKVADSVKAVEAAYHKLGHNDVAVRRQEVRDLDAPLVDVILTISEGGAFKVGEIVITKNSVTRQNVILREIQLKPGRPLDKAALEDSKQRLEDMGLFKWGSPRLTLQPPTEDRPDERDVVVEVEETQTGSIGFQAAWNTDQGPTVGLSVTERNFDLYNPPSSFDDLLNRGAFRGGGQTLNLLLQPGTITQDYSLSWTEPHLWETDNRLTLSGAYRFRNYKQYDEERYGGTVVVGRRFGTRWRGDVSFRNEWVSLSDLEDDSAADYFDVADLNLVSTIGVELARTTYDRAIRPGRGTRFEVGVEQAGLLGDFTFTKFKAGYNAYFTVHESFQGERTIFSIAARTGYIPQDEDDVPTYERFRLGGRTFRGFDFQTISPKGLDRSGNLTDDPVGGTWSLFLGAQIDQPIYKDIFSVVGFVDTGTVTNRFGVDDYRASVGAGLRISVPGLTPVPIALDFGFPILKQRGDQERVFSLSVDIPF